MRRATDRSHHAGTKVLGDKISGIRQGLGKAQIERGWTLPKREAGSGTWHRRGTFRRGSRFSVTGPDIRNVA